MGHQGPPSGAGSAVSGHGHVAATAYNPAVAYPREDIDKVRERTDLAELAAEVTKVKRSGRSVMAICPFHGEKTPSLSIDAARGLYHCFGCGKSGDVFKWVQETQGLDFVGALELLARRAGITLTESPGDSQRRGRRETLVAAVADAVAFYTNRLRSGDDAGSARSYLRGRGYDTDVVTRFSLGYSPDTWESLTNHLKGKDHSEAVIVDAGLGSRSSRGSVVDRFRGRVMFPIFDLRGDPVGFGARLLDGDGPKYLNSPETSIYQKSRLLYGLNWAKSDIVRTRQAVVVEGYTDVIALHLAGRSTAVATCGTALGEDHLALLKRFTDRIIFAFDPDAAGKGAAERVVPAALRDDLDLRRAVLPGGRDPADLVSDGATAELLAAIDDSRELLDLGIEQAMAPFDLTEPEGRGRAAHAAAEVIKAHPRAEVRDEYVEKISRLTGVERDIVWSSVESRPRQARQQAARQPRTSAVEKAERELLRLLLANDGGLRRHDVDASLLEDDDLRLVFDAVAGPIMALPPGTAPDLGALLSGAGSLGDLLSELALEAAPLPAADDIVLTLRRGRLSGRIKDLQIKAEHLDPERASEEYLATLEELKDLERQRRELQVQP